MGGKALNPIGKCRGCIYWASGSHICNYSLATHRTATGDDPRPEGETRPRCMWCHLKKTGVNKPKPIKVQKRDTPKMSKQEALRMGRDKYIRQTQEIRDEALRLHAEGLTDGEIAVKVGRCVQWVRNMRRAHGLKPNPRKETK